MKRAIALAGGGPAVGLSLGALKRLHQEPDIRFDVWTLSCIGAWLGIVWNQAAPGTEAETADSFFRRIFRRDDIYDRFPIAAAFAPDFVSAARNAVDFVLDPHSYRNLVVPDAVQEATEVCLGYLTDPARWSVANFNDLLLNQVLAVHPWSRFLTSWIYKSRTNGLSRIFYPDSPLLARIDFAKLAEPGRPILYHNAYNLTRERLELFSNADSKYRPITGETLCACSALPYIEEPVVIGGETYCEGATVDTVNFKNLLENHPDLDEVWVSRILDVEQVRKPENLLDALNNLVMLFAATTSEDDVRLFKTHLKAERPDIRLIEIPVAFNIDYDWTWSNLDRGIRDGWDAADTVLAAYRAGQTVQLADDPGTPVAAPARKPARRRVRAET